MEGSGNRFGEEALSRVTEKSGTNYGVHDVMRYGPWSARDDITPAHPLEKPLANQAVREEAMRMQMLENTMGSSVPLMMQIERSIVSKIQRMPPLQSSMIALETLTGMNTRLTPQDIFNPPSESLVSVNTHAAMQRKMNLN